MMKKNLNVKNVKRCKEKKNKLLQVAERVV